MELHNMSYCYLCRMKRFAAGLLIFISLASTSRAQFNGGGGGGTTPEFTLAGTIKDKEKNQPIAFATIYVKHLKDTTFFSGGLANDSGVFLIEQLRPGPYFLTVSFIGYASYTDTILLRPPDLKMDLGTIFISSESKNIDEYTFTEEKSDFVLGIDRKIFNVEKNSIAAGGSVLDALRQVPTVSVDVDGTITLRGTGSFVIFINGKTSGLTVDNRSQI